MSAISPQARLRIITIEDIFAGQGYRSKVGQNGLGLCTMYGHTGNPCVYDVRRFPTLDGLPFTHLHVYTFPPFPLPHSKNLPFNSGVGIIHWSFFPNQR